ncbi:hypothetical protein [Synechococcus sp. CCY9202]|uniref:hypothetical protein n=1 Tax=Synechococcus sp. CCY9202 TaxID=174698 RepID=UPI002B2049B1|nr:hypothetical protein [Synechococcus sp. CCY9202]MEA5423946.1 hypothetical protein [Synechococcus sp. CCY9202]
MSSLPVIRIRFSSAPGTDQSGRCRSWASGLPILLGVVASSLMLQPLAATAAEGMGAASGDAPRARTPAEPQVLRAVPPLATPDAAVEKALLHALFPASAVDADGHGPDHGTQEWKQACRHIRQQACLNAGNLRYAYNRVDLNGDGSEEVVATVIGPTVCGTGGCSLLIFQNQHGTLEPISRMSLFKDPLIVTSRLRGGWKELISRVRIDAGHGFYALLTHDGSAYPRNPSTPPAEPLQEALPGTAYLGWQENGNGYHPLPCAEKRP